MTCFLALAPALLADDGYIAISGAAMNYGKSAQVQMVSERVVINLGDLKSNVDATFHFKNLGGPITVTMGFPEHSDRGRPSIYNFRSEVDGSAVKVQRKFLLGGQEDLNHKAVWLKQVKFGKHQSRTVHVSYRSDNAYSFTGSMWHEYVLSTGATWAKRIEKCELVIDSSGMRFKRDVIPTFDKYVDPDDQDQRQHGDDVKTAWKSIGPHRITTTLFNIKPNFDLNVQTAAGFYKFKINGQTVPFDYFSVLSSPIWPRMINGEIWMSSDFNALGALFGGEDERRKDPSYGSFAYWSNPVVPGRQIQDRSDRGHVKIQLRNKKIVFVPIKKDVWLHLGPESQRLDMVSLKQVVQALGGTYRLDKKSGYVLMDFPNG